MSSEGQRLLVVQVSDEERAPRRFHLNLSWFEELKAKVAASVAGMQMDCQRPYPRRREPNAASRA